MKLRPGTYRVLLQLLVEYKLVSKLL